MKINKKTLNFTIIIFGICIIIPAIIYTINFWNSSLSEKPEIWGAFGDYFGGILNPIIALFGTVILGYLTYEVSKQSSDENRNLFIFQQKIVAYQKIAGMTSELDAAENKMKIHNGLMVKLGSVGNKEIATEQYIKAIETLLMSLSNFKIITANFSTNYGHLFKYDFESDEYKNLTKRASEYFNSMDLLKEFKNEDIDFKSEELYKQFRNFLVELKKEINTL
jgi:hypothetical protein